MEHLQKNATGSSSEAHMGCKRKSYPVQYLWSSNHNATCLDAGHGPIGFNVTLLNNSLALNQFFLDNLSSLPFEVGLFTNVC